MAYRDAFALGVTVNPDGVIEYCPAALGTLVDAE
jgi:hypothetical protein